MKYVAWLFLGVVFTFSSAALAADEKPVRSITVSGTVETQTAPDQIAWWISLSDNDKNLVAAKKRSDEKISAVLALRKKLGVGDGDISTGPVSVRREYTRDPNGNQGEFKYFVVSRSVTIRQHDLKRFDEFLDTLVASADMEVGFNFESSRIYEVRAETRLKALKAAKEKAAAMAEAMGVKLGPVLTINEHPQSEDGRYNGGSNHLYLESRPSIDAAIGTLVPGAITEQVTVYATFELE